YQYTDGSLGDAYARQGLRDLIRLDANRDHYHPFVAALAQRILALAGRYDIPPYPHRPEFDEVEAAVPPATLKARAAQHGAGSSLPRPRPPTPEAPPYARTRPMLNPIEPQRRPPAAEQSS